MTNIQIIAELNGKDIITQDKDIEIERLQTTCVTLNNRVTITEDLQSNIEVLQRRLADSEAIRAKQTDDINSLTAECQQKDRTINSLNNTVASHKSLIDQLNAENNNLKADVQHLLAQQKKLEEELENATQYII